MEVTDSALKELAHILETHAAPVIGIRIKGESTSPLKVDFKLSVTQEASVTAEDKVTPFEYEGAIVNIYMDPKSQPYSDHLKLDYIQALMGNGFKINYDVPIPDHIDTDVYTAVKRILEDKINPGIAAHGGSVSLVDLKDNTMFLEFSGGCQGCAASARWH
jgi:Fe/S biogenesis protein NfuA